MEGRSKLLQYVATALEVSSFIGGGIAPICRCMSTP